MLQDKFSDGRVLSDHAPILADLKFVGVASSAPDVGTSTTQAVEAGSGGLEEISPLLRACVEFIRKNGLDSEGLFRVPGSKEVVDRIINDPQYANSSNIDALVSWSKQCG